MSDVWNPAFATVSPVFGQLHQPERWQGFAHWPDVTQLNGVLPAGLRNANGVPVQFVTQDNTLPFPHLYYEERSYHYGLVATRPCNWHDFFNALVWRQYPLAKVAINALHCRDREVQPQYRTPQRDALTLLDESGVILVASDANLLDAVQDFDWQRVFVAAQAAWGRQLACFAFGHALLEKFLTPYVGLTAHAVLVEVADTFFMRTRAEQQALLDDRLAKALTAGGLVTPRTLNPFPVLGVPGWWPLQTPAFYADTQYFRPRNRPRHSLVIRATGVD